MYDIWFEFLTENRDQIQKWFSMHGNESIPRLKRGARDPNFWNVSKSRRRLREAKLLVSVRSFKIYALYRAKGREKRRVAWRWRKLSYVDCRHIQERYLLPIPCKISSANQNFFLCIWGSCARAWQPLPIQVNIWLCIRSRSANGLMNNA